MELDSCSFSCAPIFDNIWIILETSFLITLYQKFAMDIWLSVSVSSFPSMTWLALAAALMLALAERPQRVFVLDTEGFHVRNETVSEKKKAFSYPKLNQKIKQLEKETGEYADQVKGPVMDEADIWLQKKLQYEDSAHLLSKGMTVERQLLHKLRVEIKNNGTKKMKEMEDNLKHVEDANGTNHTNDSNSSAK